MYFVLSLFLNSTIVWPLDQVKVEVESFQGTTIIACMRNKHDPSIKGLETSPRHPTSTLLIIRLDSSSDNDFTKLPKTLQSDGILALDVVIANAGASSGHAPILTTPLAALRSDFETNTLGPRQALPSLLRPSEPLPNWGAEIPSREFCAGEYWRLGRGGGPRAGAWEFEGGGEFLCEEGAF
jgi:NAD(P)-dependent dehydrogenase (short-subunit alcohol dehydrogenase family)